jgi:hypothetical protein
MNEVKYIKDHTFLNPTYQLLQMQMQMQMQNTSNQAQ